MRIGPVAHQLGTTPHAIRFYERRGALPGPSRTGNRYREYARADVERIRLLLGLRQLDLPLYQAAGLAGMCAEGHCDQVSQELREVIPRKRAELEHRVAELQYLDRRLAHLAGDLAEGDAPRPLITLGKESTHDGSV